MAEIAVKFRGVSATVKDHSSIEIIGRNTRILVEPTIKLSDIDGVILTDIDRDEFTQWKYYKENNVPIYATKAIKQYVEERELGEYITPFEGSLKIGNLRVLAIKIPVSPHEPMMGIKLPAYDLVIAPELPPYLGQAFIESIGLPPAHLIAGIGSYSKEDHKISFLKFREELLRARRGKEKGILSLTLTNFRTDLKHHKADVLGILKRDWDVPVTWAASGMELAFSGKNVREKAIIEKKIEYKNGQWCVVHCHGPKVGENIKCYPGTKTGYKQALAFHRAIARRIHKAFDLDTEFELLYKSIELEDDDLFHDTLIDLARRKGLGETDLTLKSKTLPPTSYKIWKRIRKRLDGKTITMLVLKPVDYQKLKSAILDQKSLTFGYKSRSKPVYRFELPTLEEDLESAKWEDKKLLVDIKADGLRVTLSKIGREARVFVDPEDLKRKSPDVSNRLPKIVEEAIRILPTNTIVDAEFYAAKGGIAQHRTVANGILNSRYPAEKLAPFSYLYVFDILYWKGINLLDKSLEERLKYLSKINSSEHIKIENTTHSLEATASGYKVTGKSSVKKAVEKIIKGQHGLQENIQEGVMIKTLDGTYEMPQNHGWAKAKQLYEVDTIAYNRTLVKGQTAVWNYDLGLNISKEYFDKLPGKVKIEIDGKYFMKYGRSDNSKLNLGPATSKVLRVASEEVNRFENKEYPNAPWFRGYINIAMQAVPEKNISDKLGVLDKLSTFQARRITIEELARLKIGSLPNGIQSVIDKLKTLSDDDLIKLHEIIEKRSIEKWHIPYKPEAVSGPQLRDDWRLLVAVQVRLDKGQKVRIQEGKEEYFTQDILADMGAKLAREIIKRKRNKKIVFTVNLEGQSAHYKNFWKHVSSRLNKNERNILMGEEND